MARNKRMYTKTIAISPADKLYVQEIKNKQNKQTEAGALASIIQYYREQNK